MSRTATLLVALSTFACGRSSSPAPPPPAQPAPPAVAPAVEPHARVEPVGATFHHVNMYVADDVVIEIHDLRGELVTTRPGQPPFFDDARSFSVRVERGEVAISPESLTALLNNYVFAYDGAPLKQLKTTIEDGRLKLSGRMHKAIDVPFTIVADLSLADDGRIRLHPISVKAIGIPAGGLMKMFGIKLDGLIKIKQAPGVEIVDNDLLLWPDRILPAPKIEGRLTSAAIVGDRLVQRFGAAPAKEPESRTAENYLYFRGGTLRFGRLTMTDTDLRLIDSHPADPFDFSLPHYQSALVQGYEKLTATGGLRVVMPDYRAVAGKN